MQYKWAKRAVGLFAGVSLLAFLAVQSTHAQAPVTAPPNILVLVHQEFKFDSGSSREKLDAQIAQDCGRIDVPNQWIDLEAITGTPERLSFDPFDSFADIDDAYAAWPKIFTSHPEIGDLQQELRSMETKERTIIAVRRNDLSYQAGNIDLSKARFMRVLEVRLLQGHEADFAEAFKALRSAYTKIKADLYWVVYQVNVGAPLPTFLAFVPMSALKQNDDLLSYRPALREAEGETVANHLEQIAKEAYAGTESNLYMIRPDLSHVSRDFAEGDPDFWVPKPVSLLVRPAAPASESKHADDRKQR
jgi:hypothetical protein